MLLSKFCTLLRKFEIELIQSGFPKSNFKDFEIRGRLSLLVNKLSWISVFSVQVCYLAYSFCQISPLWWRYNRFSCRNNYRVISFKMNVNVSYLAFFQMFWSFHTESLYFQSFKLILVLFLLKKKSQNIAIRNR